MKKLLVLPLVLLIVFMYFFEGPALSKAEAASIAGEHLRTPPPEWEPAIGGLKGEWKMIDAYLSAQPGIWRHLFNQQEWTVTMRNGSKEAVVVIDAYSGELLEMLGLLN